MLSRRYRYVVEQCYDCVGDCAVRGTGVLYTSSSLELQVGFDGAESVPRRLMPMLSDGGTAREGSEF